MLRDLVRRNRSFRRFRESEPVEESVLRDLVDLARLTPSRSNLQPLKYVLVHGSSGCGLVFPHLRWAAYLPDWHGPDEGERPSGYIVIVGDNEITTFLSYEPGIVAQTMLLGAVERGLGGCMMTDVAWDALAAALDLPERYQPVMVLALGYPDETIVVSTIRSDRDFRYWRTPGGEHHVPKRSLEDVILRLPRLLSSPGAG